MRYKIAYDSPGRIRIRTGQGVFNASQGYGIEELLLNQAGVIDAETCHINGSILIYYNIGLKDKILKIISELDKKNLPESQGQERNAVNALNNDFYHSMVSTIGIHYFKKLLPAPIRTALAFFRAVSFIRKGLISLLNGKIGVDVLDAVAVTTALFQKDYSTATSVMMLLSVSELLEDYTRKKAKQTLADSLALNIDKVWKIHDGEEVLTPVGHIKIGENIKVTMGNIIPLDGVITGGEGVINEASMTGEPLGVHRSAGESVYAGTVVEEGEVIVEVKTLADNTRIHNIVSLIDNSENLKAEVQGKAEKLADSIVPFSFITALATLVITRNVAKAVSVLMVDYSCAIKLSTPICVISAMNESSKQRILIKGGKYLEAYANADTIVFDKTGTLTEACPKVSKIIPFGEYSWQEVLKISACLEEHFPHSVAKAIVKQAEIEQLSHKEEHAKVEYIVAHGISSSLYGKRAIIGSAHFVFEDEGIHLKEEENQIIQREIGGYSAVYLAIGEKLAGVICVSDPVRSEAKSVLDELKSYGINDIIMLTGDGEAAAKAACNELGITKYYSQVLPEDKANIITSLKEQGHKVIMVGDGINDSPALSCADVSVAMKDGSDIAKEVADITLLSENLEGLVTLRKLSQDLFQRISRNYRAILGINTSLLLLGIGGVIQPSTSALLHNTSTMIISGTSMRPYLKNNDEKETETLQKAE